MAVTINFDELFTLLKNNVLTFAKTAFQAFTRQAEEDAQKLLDSLKQRLARWTMLLAKGDLTQEDFELLVSAQQDLIEMTALQEAGVALIETERFRNGLINLIIDTIFKAVTGL